MCINLHQGLNTVAEGVIFETGGHPVIQSRNISKGRIDLVSKIKYVGQEDWKKYKNKFKPSVGDILFSNIGTVGKTAVVSEDKDYLIHWNIFIFKVNKDLIDPNYLSYILNMLINNNHYSSSMTGGTVKFITKQVIKNTMIPLPPPPEQKKIVEYLDSLSEKVKSLQQIQAETAANLTALRQSILHQAFEGKL